MNPQLSRGLSGARQVILTGGAVVGVLCILVAIGAVTFGLRPLVFRSGSMSPTIDTGALAIARHTDAVDLRKGDIVSVPTQTGERVTHRILALEHDGQDAILTLKGDANDAPDLAPYRVSHADRVLFSVPRVGYVIGWLTGPLGLFFLGLYAAFLLSVIVRRPGQSPDDGPGEPPADKPRSAGGRRKATGTRRGTSDRVGHHSLRVLVPAVALTFAAGTFAQVWALPTLAAWTDAGTVTGTKLTAYEVPAPDGNLCAPISPGSKTSRGVRLTWPSVSSSLPALTYPKPVATASSGTFTTSNVTTSGSNKTFTVTYNPGTNSNKNQTVTVTANAYLTSKTTWTSPTTTWKFRTGGNQTTQPVCGDAVPPTITFQAPDATSRNVADEKAFISDPANCRVNTVILCGTIDDASSFTVTYNFKRVVGSTTSCWSGTAWGTNCTAYLTASTAVVGSITSWYAPGTQSVAYPTSGGAGNYTLTVVATDSWSNVTTAVLTFILT